MRPRQRQDRIARLAAARHAEQQRFGALQRNLVAAEFLDEVEAEIDRSVDAAAAEHLPILGDEVLGPPEDFWIAPPENVGDAPMGGRLLAVEQPGFGEKG